MNRRRLLLFVSSIGAVSLAGCASSQKGDKLVGTFHIDPNDPYGKLKQYRSSINLLSARLAVAFQNLFSIGELYKEGPRGDEIMKASLEDIKTLHAELKNTCKKPLKSVRRSNPKTPSFWQHTMNISRRLPG